jgi:methionyl aminopeptidase
MIQLKTKDDIARIRDAGRILVDTMRSLKGMIAPGLETGEIDQVARSLIEANGARPAFLGYFEFPGGICISLNHEVIHGIPGPQKLHAGDLVKLDLGVELNGYYADAAWTFPVGETTEARKELMAVTRNCLDAAVSVLQRGTRIREIGKAVSTIAESKGYGVVKQYCGHGVGFAIHEDPQVPNYVGSGPNPRLKPGMVIALEPMINAGTWEVDVLEDGWTVVTTDGSDSAHFEYTVAVTEDGAEILTPLAEL